MSSLSGTVVGIDVGGTKVDVALAGSTSELIRCVRLATCVEDGPDALFERLRSALKELAAAAQRPGRGHHPGRRRPGCRSHG